MSALYGIVTRKENVGASHFAMIVGLIIAWAWVSLLVFTLAVVRRETPLQDETGVRMNSDNEAMN